MKCIFPILTLCFALWDLKAAESDAFLREHLPADPQATFVEGVQGWRFLPAELRHLLAGDPSNDPKKPLAAIADFHRQLQTLGIRLILVPVPAKAAIHPEKLDARLASLAASEKTFYETLRQDGIEVIDLAEIYKKAPADYYCQRDTHWNGTGIRLAADQIAEKLAGSVSPSSSYETHAEDREIQGDLGGDRETLRLDFVRDKETGEHMMPDRNSPVLLLGDSHLLVFHEGGDMHATGAGLPDQVASRIGAPVDVLAVRGSGATTVRVSLARKARANSDYLKNKKVIVWCLAARELTQADSWKPIPLLPGP